MNPRTKLFDCNDHLTHILGYFDEKSLATTASVNQFLNKKIQEAKLKDLTVLLRTHALVPKERIQRAIDEFPQEKRDIAKKPLSLFGTFKKFLIKNPEEEKPSMSLYQHVVNTFEPILRDQIEYSLMQESATSFIQNPAKNLNYRLDTNLSGETLKKYARHYCHADKTQAGVFLADATGKAHNTGTPAIAERAQVIANELIVSGADLSVACQHDVLTYALNDKDCKLLKLLIQHKEVSTHIKLKESLLTYFAIDKTNIKALNILQQHGVDFSRQEIYRYACFTTLEGDNLVPNAKWIVALLEKGLSLINLITNTNFFNALVSAISNKKNEIETLSRFGKRNHFNQYCSTLTETYRRHDCKFIPALMIASLFKDVAKNQTQAIFTLLTTHPDMTVDLIQKHLITLEKAHYGSNPDLDECIRLAKTIAYVCRLDELRRVQLMETKEEKHSVSSALSSYKQV